MREIIRHSDANIKSWTDKCEDDITRPTRTFIIEVRPLLHKIFQSSHQMLQPGVRGSYTPLHLQLIHCCQCAGDTGERGHSSAHHVRRHRSL